MAPDLLALGIDRLSIDERIALANAIWDSIGTTPHEPLLTAEQRDELQRRLDHHATHPDDVVPWEQIKADALARFRSSMAS